MSISLEQAPDGTNDELKSYLERMFLSVNQEIDKSHKFPERRTMPYKPQIGDVRYFGNPADHSYDADITIEGFWGYTNSGWEILNRPADGWRDITSEVKVRGTGGTDPTWSVINSTAFSAYKFGLSDKCWMSFHMPHDYVLGSDIYFHAHWLADGADTNSVKWEFTYSYAHGHDQAAFVLGTPDVITAEQTMQNPGIQYRHYVTETIAVTIADCEPDGIIEVAIGRITNGGTNNGDNIFLLTCDVHYESNSK